VPDPRPGGHRTLYGLLILAVLAAASAAGWVGAQRLGADHGDRPAALLAPFAPVLDTVASLLSGDRRTAVPTIEAESCRAATPAPPPDPRC
jgi:hypothetical protein